LGGEEIFMHGLLLVDKPAGITSSEVVRIVKRKVRPAKVGHTGTLDPAATGLVVILIGACTRALDFLDESRKEYRLTVRLGEETDTDDREGKIISTADPSGITRERIEEVLESYRGVIDQTPPAYSAIKKNGVPLYKLARQGIFPEIPPRKVEIFSLGAIEWESPLLRLDMVCSKGTYARALARDVGRDLGVGGRLEDLRRTASGAFRVEDAIIPEEIELRGRDAVTENLIDLSSALSHIPELRGLPNEIKRLVRGNAVNLSKARLSTLETSADQQQPRLFKVLAPDGGLMILARPRPRGSDIALQPVRIFKMFE
jgi:tRNA pseudouridine55 synthase